MQETHANEIPQDITQYIHVEGNSDLIHEIDDHTP